MSHTDIKNQLFEIAVRLVQTGPGFAQEGVALREARDLFMARELTQEQEILDCWHELFNEGKVVWGYNLDNPGAPFFRVPHHGSKSPGRNGAS